MSKAKSERIETVNIMKSLSQRDPQFKSYLKLSQQRPQGQLKSNQVEKITTRMVERIPKVSYVGYQAAKSNANNNPDSSDQKKKSSRRK